jgi:hypothetical protein
MHEAKFNLSDQNYMHWNLNTIDTPSPTCSAFPECHHQGRTPWLWHSKVPEHVGDGVSIVFKFQCMYGRFDTLKMVLTVCDNYRLSLPVPQHRRECGWSADRAMLIWRQEDNWQPTDKVMALYTLTLTLLKWRIWWALNNASRWQMLFNLAFKGLITRTI